MDWRETNGLLNWNCCKFTAVGISWVVLVLGIGTITIPTFLTDLRHRFIHVSNKKESKSYGKVYH